MKYSLDILLPPVKAGGRLSLYFLAISSFISTSIYAHASTSTTIPPLKKQDIVTLVTGNATAGFSKYSGQSGTFNQIDFNPLFIVSYKDFLLMRSSLDFSLDVQGASVATLDAANIQWLFNDKLSFGIGKFDSALGQFASNLSPNWINKLPSAPLGFDGDASPQADIGIQLHGRLPLEQMAVNYVLYISNGPQALVNDNTGSINNIQTDGVSTNTGNYVIGGRLGFIPIPTLDLGLSVAKGQLSLIDDGANSIAAGTQLQKGRSYQVLGADIAYRHKELSLRAEIIQQGVNAQAGSIVPLAQKWLAWYAQSSYRLPSTNWEPVIRYSNLHTPVPSMAKRQWALGLDYWFAPSIVAKLDYELNSGPGGSVNNPNQVTLQCVFGF